MARRPCTNQCEGCPLAPSERFSDTHHLAYSRNRFRSRIEKQWREQDFNKIDIPRCLHNAIHASGYLPDKPSRDDMLAEIWSDDTPERAIDEREKQLYLGRLMLERGEVSLDEDIL